jgi:hypothetical protein
MRREGKKARYTQGHEYYYNILSKSFFIITSINTYKMKQTTPALKTYLDVIKPNPVVNINMLASNNRIIEITLLMC